MGYCAATCYHAKFLEKQQQHERLTQILESKGFIVHVLPVLLGNTGEVFRSTLSNIKLAGADADRISKLASRLSTHAQKSMQSIIQSRRVAEATPHQSARSHRRQYEPPWGAYLLMVIGTGISLWRYLAQSQVDSQTHAERRIIYLFPFQVPRQIHPDVCDLAHTTC